MAYVDLATIQATDPGDILTAAWCDQARDNGEFLIDPPACSIYNSSAVSLTTGIGTVLNADSENYDNDSMHSTVSNTSRITIQTSGRYLITATMEFSANATGYRMIQILLNTASIAHSVVRLNAVSGAATFTQTAITSVLAAGDYLEAQGLQGSGGGLNTTLREFTAQFLTR